MIAQVGAGRYPLFVAISSVDINVACLSRAIQAQIWVSEGPSFGWVRRVVCGGIGGMVF